MNATRKTSARLLNPSLWKKVAVFRRRFRHSKPFRHVVIHRAFKPKPLRQFQDYLTTNHSLRREHHRGHKASFYDISRDIRHPLVRRWFAAVFKEMIPLAEAVTKKKVSRLHVPVRYYVYGPSDYLVPHSDNVGQRALAFVINLSDFEVREGGRLLLLRRKAGKTFKIAKRIPRRFNDLVLFEVNRTSFHQVEKIRVYKKRMTISGWFLHKDYDQTFLKRLKENPKRVPTLHQESNAHSTH